MTEADLDHSGCEIDIWRVLVPGVDGHPVHFGYCFRVLAGPDADQVIEPNPGAQAAGLSMMWYATEADLEADAAEEGVILERRIGRIWPARNKGGMNGTAEMDAR